MKRSRAGSSTCTLYIICPNLDNSVSTEFLGLMKKVAKSPLVMDVLNIANVQRQLERLADLLTKIQKALGEYLERERASFPRFYFVGDEDLLEIIGNSKNLPRLQKHFKKMFAGVHSIVLDEDHAQVLGLASKEGEEVSERRRRKRRHRWCWGCCRKCENCGQFVKYTGTLRSSPWTYKGFDVTSQCMSDAPTPNMSRL